MSLSRLVYQVTHDFPADEKFGLVSQMRRSAVSIPSNIAEGNRRGTLKEYRRFVQMALGSSAELETQRILAHDLCFLEPTKNNELESLIEETMRMLGGLEKSINDKIETPDI